MSAPFVIRRDGTLLDRETETVIGRVYLDRDRGWTAENQLHRFDGLPRKYVARRAWDDWHRGRKST